MAIEKTEDGRVVMDKEDAERLAAAAKPKAAPEQYWADEDIPDAEALSKMNDGDLNLWAAKMNAKRVNNG